MKPKSCWRLALSGHRAVLDFICYHILADPEIRRKIAEELRDITLDWSEEKPTWAQLEKLPFFQAVIKEGLR